MRRLTLKLLTIAVDYSVVVPPATTTARPLPPQEAKRLARVLATTERVAVFRTRQPSVARVIYLGDQVRGHEDIRDISGIGDSRVDEPAPGDGVIPRQNACRTMRKRQHLPSIVQRLNGLFDELIILVCRRAGGLSALTRSSVRVRTIQNSSCAHVICGRVSVYQALAAST